MSQNLAMATSMLYLTGKTIGAPILLHFLKPTLKKLGEKLGGKFLNKIKPKHDIPHNPFLSVSGLSFQTTNFTLVLDFQHLDQFSTNISSDIALSNYLVKNLTLTNSIFHQFVENELLDVLYYMARTSITEELDNNAPILAVLHQRKSLILVDFYLTFFTDINTVTSYNLASLPYKLVGDNIYSLDIPNNFTTAPMSSNFVFPGIDNTPNLDACLNLLLGQPSSDITHDCPVNIFPFDFIKQVLIIEDIRIFYARGTMNTVKISCPKTTLKLF